MSDEWKPDLNLALVGNSSFSALIDRRANVVWACLPRFDSDPVFDALLKGTAFPDDGFYVVDLYDFERWKLSPDVQHGGAHQLGAEAESALGAGILSRLVVVSNRVPLPRGTKPPEGGLATARDPALPRWTVILSESTELSIGFH